MAQCSKYTDALYVHVTCARVYCIPMVISMTIGYLLGRFILAKIAGNTNTRIRWYSCTYIDYGVTYAYLTAYTIHFALYV